MSLAVDSPVVSPKPISSRSKLQRGLLCLATFCVAPFGWFLPLRFFRCTSDERLEQGLVLILPGIEGRSFLNLAILHGLIDAGLPYALEIVDWTTGNKFLTLYHLRAWKRNQRIARELAQRIVAYHANYPGRPVWIIGHSGGGGMALLTAEALPAEQRLTGIILLAAAVSPRFDLAPAFHKVERGIWAFHSWLDCLFVGLGTTIFGTLDGRHMPAAGMIGFFRTAIPSSKQPSRPGHRKASDPATLDPISPQPTFTQTAFHPRMIADFNLGGHFGCVQRVFVAEHVAQVISRNHAAHVGQSTI